MGKPPAAPEFDLPAVVGSRRTKQSSSPFELDLTDADLPAPVISPLAVPGGSRTGIESPPTSPPELELGDLPAARPAAPHAIEPMSAYGDIDLPSVGSSTNRDFQSRPGRLEFDAPLPARANIGSPPRRMDAELPSPAVGLPSPSAGLPSPAAALPSPAAALPSLGGIGLPSSAAQLPTVRGSPSAVPDVDSATREQDSFGELELPLIGSGVVSAAASALAPDPSLGLAALDGAISVASTVGPQSPDLVTRQAGGGISYGEVNLDAGGSDIVLAGAAEVASPSEDDMEFGAIPQERADAKPLGLDLRQPSLSKPRPTRAEPGVPPRKRRAVRVAAVVAVVGVLGGAGLGLLPDVGPFGTYTVQDLLRGAEYRHLLAEAVRGARSEVALDTYPACRRAGELIERAKSQAKRVKALAAYAAFLGYARQMRFGSESEVTAAAQLALDELAQAKNVPFLELARAAREASTGQLARARSSLDALLRADPNDVDALVLRAEVALRAQEPKAAIDAWRAAQPKEQSARTSFGLARALYAAGQADASEREAKAALARNPNHVGARILLARIAWETRRGEVTAVQLLQAVLKERSLASATEIVGLETLLGDIHLERSRISHAEAAYGEALKTDPKAADALRGLGDAMYRAGRYSEALGRYEAASKANPDELSAKVGVAKTMLGLERLQDAKAMLDRLRASYPRSMEVAFWHGSVAEALGLRDDAEQAFRRAIELGGDDPSTIVAYVALAQLENQRGLTDLADQTLTAARKKLPERASVHKALGEYGLSQGRYAEAIAEFRVALGLDAGDIGARYRLGVALRRNRDFDAAQEAFDKVSDVDRDYPGLALERGLLFESSGRTDEALKSYEAALAKAPDDLDLMLRVGCSKVAAGRAEQAEELLKKVLGQRGASAETNHCYGRALLLKGKDVMQALQRLERAVELDPNRAEYHLYVGWAALEAGRIADAERALKRALELDQGLADAYWQRGVLRYRQGAVKDAVTDLKKALELRPSRYEAHAALADAYYDLGMEAASIAEWDKAVAAEPDNATWLFRYGRLLAANHNDEQAIIRLGKALELAEKQPALPRWCWEAHLLLARSLGPNPEAPKHWRAFLGTGPLDSPYRTEAMQALKRAGQPWQGN